jgi:S-adenosylmethionine decarboxylase
MKKVGKHIIAELYGVKEELIIRKEKVKEIVEYVVNNAELTKVGEIYKQFNPHGVTAIILLAESHLAVHTWPEHNLVNLDIFTCGKSEKAEKAFELFVKKLKPKKHRKYILNRG